MRRKIRDKSIRDFSVIGSIFFFFFFAKKDFFQFSYLWRINHDNYRFCLCSIDCTCNLLLFKFSQKRRKNSKTVLAGKKCKNAFQRRKNLSLHSYFLQNQDFQERKSNLRSFLHLLEVLKLNYLLLQLYEKLWLLWNKPIYNIFFLL